MVERLCVLSLQRRPTHQIRSTLAGAIHNMINTDLSETIMPAKWPVKVIQFQPMYNFLNTIEVPKYMQRSPRLQPICTQKLGAPLMQRETGLAFTHSTTATSFSGVLFMIRGRRPSWRSLQKNGNMATFKYRMEDWEARLNISFDAYMARMTAVQQIEPEEKKRHDGKIKKLNTTALQFDAEPAFRIEP